MSPFLKITSSAAAIGVAAISLAACGSQGISKEYQSGPYAKGAELFAQRCSGCHTLAAAGAQGSASKVTDKEKTDGPSFDDRKETSVDQVLFAIRNGGFSGQIMPQNIVVGQDAEEVAKFLVKVSGTKAIRPPAPKRSVPAGK